MKTLLRAMLIMSILAAVTAHNYHRTGSSGDNFDYLENEDPVIISANPSSAPTTWVRFRSDAANYYWDGGRPNLGSIGTRKSHSRTQEQNARNWNANPYVNGYVGDNFVDNDASVAGFGPYNMGRSWAIYNMNWDNSNIESYRKRFDYSNDWVDQKDENNNQWASSDW